MRGWIWAVFAVVGTIAPAGPVVFAQVTLSVRGDPQAWEDIKAAWAKLATVKSYRIRGTNRQGETLMWEIVNPDRVHHRRTSGTSTTETVRIGSQTVVREGDNCIELPVTVLDPSPNVAAGATEVVAEKGNIESLGGGRAQTYAYTLTYPATAGRGPRMTRTKLFVAVDTGLLKRVQGLDERGGIEFTWDYYDYNAAITITPLRCS